MADKYLAHGTLLKVGDALVSPTYTTIAQVTSVAGVAVSRGSQTVPTHDDTGIMEKLVDALGSADDIPFSVMFDPSDATHDESTGLIDLALSGDTRPWQIIFPDSLGQWAFEGVISQFSTPALDANTGLLTADCVVTPTNVPVFT